VALICALKDETTKLTDLHAFRRDPTADPRFLQLDNVVLLQHDDSGVIDTCNAMSQLVCYNFVVRFSGRSLATPVV
jgi:lactate dehydrogenase-like 2-hydroxyacid dehydrogenase